MCRISTCKERVVIETVIRQWYDMTHVTIQQSCVWVHVYYTTLLIVKKLACLSLNFTCHVMQQWLNVLRGQDYLTICGTVLLLCTVMVWQFHRLLNGLAFLQGHYVECDRNMKLMALSPH